MKIGLLFSINLFGFEHLNLYICVMNYKIDMLLRDKVKLTELLFKGLEKELRRQKEAGKNFISDEELDEIIKDIIK